MTVFIVMILNDVVKLPFKLILWVLFLLKVFNSRRKGRLTRRLAPR